MKTITNLFSEAVESIWPVNLLAAIWGPFSDMNRLGCYDFERLVEIMDSVCSSREAHILKLRFKDGLSLREIGLKIGVSAERTRQTLITAISRLRAPEAARQYRSVPLTEMERRISELKIEQIGQRKDLQTPVSELGLSSRVLNAIVNKGYQTLGDLISTTVQDLSSLQGLGKHSVEEIRRMCEAKGYNLRKKW